MSSQTRGPFTCGSAADAAAPAGTTVAAAAATTVRRLIKSPSLRLVSGMVPPRWLVLGTLASGIGAPPSQRLEQGLDQRVSCDAVPGKKLVNRIFTAVRLPGGPPFMRDEKALQFVVEHQLPRVLIGRLRSLCVAVKFTLQRRHVVRPVVSPE